MTVIEIILGCLLLIAAVGISAASLLVKKQGKGLSAAIGGASDLMKSNADGGADAMLTKIIIILAAASTVIIIAMGILSAHAA